MSDSWTQFDLIQKLIRDVEEGRPVIPLIGAGFSVGSGIPTLAGLTEYLAKVQCYIHRSVFSLGAVEQVGQGGPRSYVSDPSSYVGDFGWPDPHRLNAELWTWVDRSCPDHRDYRRLLEQQVQVDYVEDVGRQDMGLAEMIKASFDPEPEQLARDLCERFPEDEVFAARARHFLGQPSPVAAARLLKRVPKGALRGDLGTRVRRARQIPPIFPKELKLRGNWKTLLAHLTHSNPDYVDTLFQSLLQGRQPGTTHRFLAFLTPILHIPHFLTVNFDNLLEQALRLEGLKPVVYEVSRDSPLPHSTLVQKELSVVKLHGGTFGLRVGEELDQPLDENSRKRLESYLPKRSALLVMGVGGWDRRIRDLVEVVARRRGSRVYWMHFEAECPQPIRELAACYAAVVTVRTHSTPAFLQELYYRRANSHPPSRHPYTSAIGQPIDSDEHQAEKAEDLPIHVFLNNPGDLSIGGSLRLARFVTSKAATHIPIWLDLEVMHTVEDVVAEIFRQVRKYDRWLSLTVLPTGPSPDDEDVGKAMRRIFTALSRGRYVLAFNAVESFGRPPTYHHGYHHRVFKPDDEGFFWRLFQDARRLQEGGLAGSWGPIRDSILAFSVSGESPFYDKVEQSGSPLWQRHPPRRRGRIKAPEKGSEEFDVLLLLSAFRRRRSIVALRRLKLTEERLQQLEDQGYVKRLEGGHYWMSPGMRNAIYRIGQRFTRSNELAKEMNARGPHKEVPCEPLVNLSRLADIHESIAKFYCSELFAASQEVSALLEHFYHRISSLRYLTKLDAWLPRKLTPEMKSLLESRLGDEPLGDLRLERLRSIRTVLQRETEKLLSDVASDTLLRWIDWIRDDDLRRFVVDTCLDSADRPPAVREPGPRAAEIKEERGLLADQLEDLKAHALRDKMDYPGWAALRRSEARRICGFDGEGGEFRDYLAAVSRRIRELPPERRRRVVRGVCDVWTCLHRNGEFGYSGSSNPDLEDFERFCSAYREDGGDEALWIEFLRCKAEYGLIGLSPWAKRAIPGQTQDVIKRCEWTIAACSEALERIDLLPKEDHARLRSYLHSIKAKAFYLQEKVLEAFPEVDLAQVGLKPETGANREVLAIGLLRLAELLMVHSHCVISQAGGGAGRPRDLVVANAGRHLVRAEDTLEKVFEMLAGARQNVALWAWLYQLRGQLQVEHLLLLISRRPTDHGERRRFIEQFTQRLRIGLRAIRQGLDIVPPLDNHGAADSLRDLQVDSLLRIWTELMVCGAYLTRGGQKLKSEGLWRRWSYWNLAAGIRCFEKASPFFVRLDRRFKPASYGTGRLGRARVLTWIRSVAVPSISVLTRALRQEDASWEAFLQEEIGKIPPKTYEG